MTILEWIKANAKEGANVAEAEELVQKSTFDSITSKEQAMEFIDKNTTFRSAVDSLISTAVNRHDEKFQSEKLPVLQQQLRDELAKELNPDETPEQKRIRELEERLQESDRRDAENALKAKLRTKASELKFDPELASKLSKYGDESVTLLESFANYNKGIVEAEKDRLMNDALRGKPPKSVSSTTEEITPESIESMSEADISRLFKE
jgi:hypothetical protein